MNLQSHCSKCGRPKTNTKGYVRCEHCEEGFKPFVSPMDEAEIRRRAYEAMKKADSLTLREKCIAEIAFAQGYGCGHNDTVEGHYADSEERAADWLEDAIQEGIFG